MMMKDENEHDDEDDDDDNDDDDATNTGQEHRNMDDQTSDRLGPGLVEPSTLSKDEGEWAPQDTGWQRRGHKTEARAP